VVASKVRTEEATHTFSDNWTFEIINKKSAIEAIIQDNHLRGILLDIDEKELRKYVKLIKDTRPINGIRIWNDKIIRTKVRDGAGISQ
jgi:hypothetical protein